jgi:hypothetical protein
MGLSGLLVLVLVSMSMLSGRSIAAFANYVDLDSSNRLAMDQLTSDLRQCNRVISFTATQRDIEDSGGATITYVYNSNTETFSRVAGGTTKVLLKGCESLTFTIAQRNPIGGTYDVYPAASAATAKVINVAWNCSRKILGHKANTENVQTARIVIRKQG